jgi:rare lipoprotein A
VPPVEREAKAPPAAPAPPRRGGYYLDDGPGDGPKIDLAQLSDATPRAEPLHRYANNPYVVFGKEYVPTRSVQPYQERGTASWYGKRFHGGRTSSGETYDMYAMTAAHPTLPIPSYARVTNLSNSRSVVVRINDRGPFLHGRVIDLSYAAAWKLGYVENGSALVQVEAIIPERATAAVAEAKPMPATVRTVASAADTTDAGSVYVQLGAFSARDAAESLRARCLLELADLERAMGIYLKDGLFRLQVGPYRSRSEASSIAEQIRSALEVTPLLVVR